MLKFLMTLAALDLRRTIALRIHRLANTAAWGAVAGVLVAIALVFLLVAAAIALVPYLGLAWAFAAVGGAVLLLGLIAAAVAAAYTRPPPKQSSGLGAIGSGLGVGLSAAAGAAGGAAASGPSTGGAPAAGTRRGFKLTGPAVLGAAGAALIIGMILGRRL